MESVDILIRLDYREDIFLRGVPAQLSLRNFLNEYERRKTVRLPIEHFISSGIVFVMFTAEGKRTWRKAMIGW